MGVFDNVKSIAEKTSDTIPEAKQTIRDIDDLVKAEVKQTLTHADELIVDLRQKLRLVPIVVACLCVIALAAVGTVAGVVVLLVR